MTTIGGEDRILAVVRDIDEKRRLEERLQQGDKMRAIGELAGGIAHDFNNHLSGILGFAELLKMESTNPEHLEYLQMIITSAQNAADINTKLLSFARKGDRQKVPIDLNATTADVIAILQHSVDKSINITLHKSADTPVVSGDTSQLQNALLNIGINARDALAKGGNITFTISQRYLDEHFCGAHPFDAGAGNYAEIIVSDNGCGIEPHHLPNIFNPFFTTKQKGRGTGMGLAAVYGAVKDFNGIITCESRVGTGTQFRLYLPLHSSSGILPVAEQRAFDSLQGEGLVLVVDDEPSLLLLAQRTLVLQGYTVEVCSNGEAAIRFYDNHKNTVIAVILDMIMPGMDGYATFTALRNLNRELKVLVCSGYSERGKVQKILQTHHTALLRKPYRPIDLAAALFDLIKN
jgi:nitrogen-specific signal transduction histidine kinase